VTPPGNYRPVSIARGASARGPAAGGRRVRGCRLPLRQPHRVHFPRPAGSRRPLFSRPFARAVPRRPAAATHGRAPHKLVAAFSGLGVGGPGKRLSAWPAQAQQDCRTTGESSPAPPLRGTRVETRLAAAAGGGRLDEGSRSDLLRLRHRHLRICTRLLGFNQQHLSNLLVFEQQVLEIACC